MSYRLTPEPQELLDTLRREHGTGHVLVKQAEAGLAILGDTPTQWSKRIRRLPGGVYRYRHGRCRIVYEIDEDAQLVSILYVGLRDEATYRDLGT